jgi:hypothetical protein
MEHLPESSPCTGEMTTHSAFPDTKKVTDSDRIQIVPIGESDHRSLTQTQPRDRSQHFGQDIGSETGLWPSDTSLACGPAKRAAVGHPRLIEHRPKQIRARITNLDPPP